MAAILLLTACSAPLTVTHLTISESYRQLNRSALSSDTVSDSTLIVLRTRDLLPLWNSDPEAAIASLRSAVVSQPDQWPSFFALAELSYHQGEVTGSEQDFLAAAIYAYTFLSPGTDDQPSPYDERFRQACDIYNLGLSAAFAAPGGVANRLTAGTRSLPFGSITLTVDPHEMQWSGRPFVTFQPTATLAITGLQNIYRSPGLGEPMAAQPQPLAGSQKGLQIAPELTVPTNMLLEIDDPRHQIASSDLQGRLVVHTIYDQPSVVIGGQTVPLEYDQTAARGLGLAENTAWSTEYSGFLSGTLFEQSQAHLTALEPHRHGRMPVILIHGTASSAFRWADMVNDLLQDPRIRDHFEFWFFSYASGNPIPYSALQLRLALEGAVRQLGGVSTDPALGRITLIGHSQGGLLAKMQVIDTGDQLWNGVSLRPLSSLRLTGKSRQLVHDAFFLTPVPEVQRVIFIATPQRGSYVAAFSLAQLVGRLVTLPLAVSLAGKELLSGNAGNITLGQSRLRMGSIYGMTPGSPFIKSLAAIPVAPSVHVHSIIPVATNGPLEDANDGVVRYTSAHITGVDSELIVHSSHSAQSKPATIEEVRRILLLQLAASDGGSVRSSVTLTAP